MPKPDRDKTDKPVSVGVETDELIAKLARELGRNARAEVVFGEPVERDDVTVIPVATASLGLGGGSGTRQASDHACGIGAGLHVTPLGYIELAGGRARFRRILAPWAFVSIAALGIGALAGLLLLEHGR
jgi:uncharacterized spore protein YtfJ